MPLKLNSSGGGSVTLDVPSTASAFNVIVPANAGTLVTTGSTAAVTQGMLASGVAGNGPAFSAQSSVDQTLSNSVWTKVVLQSETFDTNGAFNNSTTYRFQPAVAGYYNVNWLVIFEATPTNGNEVISALYKNGSNYAWGSNFAPATTHYQASTGSSTVYMNGSTDYLELYAFQTTGGNRLIIGNIAQQITCQFSGFLARAA